MNLSKQSLIKTLRKILVVVLSLGVACAMFAGGMFWGRSLPGDGKTICYAFCAVLFAATLAGFAIGAVRSARYIKTEQSRDPEEIIQYLRSKRERAEETCRVQLQKMQDMRNSGFLLAVFYGVAGGVIAGLAGVIFGTVVAAGGGKGLGLPVVFAVYASVLLSVAFCRLPFQVPKAYFGENKSYVREKDFPALYALAKRAADALGCAGEIHIALLSDMQAGIAEIGNVISIQIGAILFAELSEKEMYAVLLHEFAHIVSDRKSSSAKDSAYANRLTDNNRVKVLDAVTRLPFRYHEIKYMVEYQLFRFACSLVAESNADRAMLQAGREEAASALLKLDYFDLFLWEDNAKDHECFIYMNEQPPANYVEVLLEKFDRAKAQRKDFWDALLEKEIIARSASHPTLQMRLDALGVKNKEIMEIPAGDGLQEDREHAIRFVNKQIAEDLSDNFANKRKQKYLDPLARVEKWKNDGEPISPDGYPDLLEDLYAVGQTQEMLRVCDRVLLEFHGSEAANARYQKGCMMLYSFDDRGIGLVYDAISANRNYAEEGIGLIGQYCCRTGNREGLEEYRRRSLEYLKTGAQEEAAAGELKRGDRLLPDDLPESVQRDIVRKVLEIDRQEIVQAIYIIRKITGNDVVHAVILQFSMRAAKDYKAQNEVYHAVFRYLDSKPQHFALFDNEAVKAIRPEMMEDVCFYKRSFRNT